MMMAITMLRITILAGFGVEGKRPEETGGGSVLCVGRAALEGELGGGQRRAGRRNGSWRSDRGEGGIGAGVGWGGGFEIWKVVQVQEEVPGGGCWRRDRVFAEVGFEVEGRGLLRDRSFRRR